MRPLLPRTNPAMLAWTMYVDPRAVPQTGSASSAQESGSADTQTQGVPAAQTQSSSTQPRNPPPIRPRMQPSILPARAGRGAPQPIAPATTSHAIPPESSYNSQNLQLEAQALRNPEAMPYPTTSRRQQPDCPPRSRIQQDEEARRPSKRKKMGRPPLPLEKRRPAAFPRTGKRRMSYTREAKLAVLKYIEDPANWKLDYRSSVPIRAGQQMVNNWRPPNNEEVAAACAVEPRNVGQWWARRHQIRDAPKGSRRCNPVSGSKKKK